VDIGEIVGAWLELLGETRWEALLSIRCRGSIGHL
jgi:hypothetical protein